MADEELRKLCMRWGFQWGGTFWRLVGALAPLQAPPSIRYSCLLLVPTPTSDISRAAWHTPHKTLIFESRLPAPKNSPFQPRHNTTSRTLLYATLTLCSVLLDPADSSKS